MVRRTRKTIRSDHITDTLGFLRVSKFNHHRTRCTLDKSDWLQLHEEVSSFISRVQLNTYRWNDFVQSFYSREGCIPLHVFDEGASPWGSIGKLDDMYLPQLPVDDEQLIQHLFVDGTRKHPHEQLVLLLARVLCNPDLQSTWRL